MARLNPPWWPDRLKPSRWLPRRLPARRWRIVAHVEEADLIPSRLPLRGAALAGPHGAPKWLALDCPCGTGHRLLVNLDSHRRPAWRLVGTRPLTIQPSLDIIRDGARCHFTITRGAVHWAGSGHQPRTTLRNGRPESERR